MSSHDHLEPSASSERPGRAPLPLLVAVSLVGVEGAALVVYGLVQLPALTVAKATMVLTTSLFFVVYGAALCFFGWQLRRLRSWTRAPVVLAQLIQLGVAWSFRGGTTTALAAALAVVAIAVIAGVFHPESLRAVEAADADPEPDE